MGNKNLLGELVSNCKNGRDQLRKLNDEYIRLNNLKWQRDEKEDYVRNLVLLDNTFYADKDTPAYSSGRIQKGDRITENAFSYLMSDEDFEKYDTICMERLLSAGLVDKEGNPTPDYNKQTSDALQNTIDFFISTVVPKIFRKCL